MSKHTPSPVFPHHICTSAGPQGMVFFLSAFYPCTKQSSEPCHQNMLICAFKTGIKPAFANSYTNGSASNPNHLLVTPLTPWGAQGTCAGQGQGTHLVAFQSSFILSTCDLRSHMVLSSSFPFSSTKHWPVNTVMESVGTGQEVEGSMAKVAGYWLAQHREQ